MMLKRGSCGPFHQNDAEELINNEKPLLYIYSLLSHFPSKRKAHCNENRCSSACFFTEQLKQLHHLTPFDSHLVQRQHRQNSHPRGCLCTEPKLHPQETSASASATPELSKQKAVKHQVANGQNTQNSANTLLLIRNFNFNNSQTFWLCRGRWPIKR